MKATTEHIRWKLPEVLKAEGVSIYRLQKVLQHRVAPNTLARWGRPRAPKYIDLEILAKVLLALRQITGRQLELNDLIEVIEVKGVDEVEFTDWMNSDLANLSEYEPYSWGKNGPPLGKSVVHLENHGFFIVDKGENDK